MRLIQITDRLIKDVRRLQFGPPVTHVYNPLEYARKPYKLYIRRFATPPKKIVLLGMNPGPWGMAQTGVPFGEVQAVKHWMGID
ncbi:MAG: single-stranded DNA-binding protein, partial [Desulfobacteraceae bacterium]